MKTCEDCGCRVYDLGCVNCNEEAYIDRQRAELGMEACEDARRRVEEDIIDEPPTEAEER